MPKGSCVQRYYLKRKIYPCIATSKNIISTWNFWEGKPKPKIGASIAFNRGS
jgi:hypothetical protein